MSRLIYYYQVSQKITKGWVKRNVIKVKVERPTAKKGSYRKINSAGYEQFACVQTSPISFVARKEIGDVCTQAMNSLKEQYPVTAHAPNFDFRTGCPEIKRCEESKRSLKNPFASRLAEFDTTLKLLRITDQWYIVPVKFQFGQIRVFMALLLLPLDEGPKDGKRFDASIQAQIIVKRIRRNETETIRLCKKETIETWILCN